MRPVSRGTLELVSTRHPAAPARTWRACACTAGISEEFVGGTASVSALGQTRLRHFGLTPRPRRCGPASRPGLLVPCATATGSVLDHLNPANVRRGASTCFTFPERGLRVPLDPLLWVGVLIGIAPTLPTTRADVALRRRGTIPRVSREWAALMDALAPEFWRPWRASWVLSRAPSAPTSVRR